MGFWNRLIWVAATTTGATIALALYGSSQVINPKRCEHRGDPTAWGLVCDDVEFRATDGLRLSGWLARTEQSRAAIIVAHGHGGNRHTSLSYASLFYPEYSVLLPDLRGHGDSAGRHTSVGFHERLDLIGAARYLRGLGYGPIGVLGVSMGAATAILAAADGPEIDAVVADSSFAALRHAVREGARIRGYPGPITRPLAYVSVQTAAWRLRYPMRAGDPLGRVAAIAPRPILFIHGEADALIPAADSRALYAAAGEPKELWLVPGVTHARALDVDRATYRQRVCDFFDGWLRPSEQDASSRSAGGTLQAGPLEVGQPAADAGAGQVNEVA